MKIFDKALISN